MHEKPSSTRRETVTFGPCTGAIDQFQRPPWTHCVDAFAVVLVGGTDNASLTSRVARTTSRFRQAISGSDLPSLAHCPRPDREHCGHRHRPSLTPGCKGGYTTQNGWYSRPELCPKRRQVERIAPTTSEEDGVQHGNNETVAN